MIHRKRTQDRQEPRFRTKNCSLWFALHKNSFILPCVSRADKLKAKIMNPEQVHNVSFEEAVSVLERAGFVNYGGKGSHTGFRHPDGRKITLPRHGSLLKPAYIRHIGELLKSSTP